jgi:hypothetical protein
MHCLKQERRERDKVMKGYWRGKDGEKAGKRNNLFPVEFERGFPL